MTRVVRITPRYRRNADRLSVVTGSSRGLAVGLTIAALADEDTLPGPHDVRAAVPPTGSAYVRRVLGRNLWIWYTFSGAEVALVALTGDPPVPLD